MPATPPSTIRRVRAPSGPVRGPKRSEFSSAIGRAPMVKMSRMMPPTPVAAPWYGSVDDGGVVVRLDLEGGGEPAADVHRAGVLARALEDARAARGQLPQVDARALVAAVLRPHDGED